MATTPQNRLTRLGDQAKSIFESALNVISTAVSFNQGDLLVFDDTANLLKVPASESEGSTFLGVAPVTVVSGKLKQPYSTAVDASQAVTDVPGPEYGSIYAMKCHAGQTLNPGDPVYLSPGDDAQTVSATGTKQIGVYQGATVTTVSGSSYECLIGCRHPGDVLKF